VNFFTANCSIARTILTKTL